MDTTTVLAVVSCAIVFAAWLVLPHTVVQRRTETAERLPVPASA
jgi:hypothetical protein